MTKQKKGGGQGKSIWFVVAGLFSLSILVAVLLRGSNVELLNPSGQIASEQRRLLAFSVFILLDVGIPTLALFYAVAWRYRETNDKVVHTPQAKSSKKIVFLTWAMPFLIMCLLAGIMWPATHRLAPKHAIASDEKPLTIQVVALRWKWLFIYPEQDIATVNYIQIPANTPVQFILTADETPMSSFWIPQLGGQLYAMTGHENQLNLIADTPGDYTGKAAEINGAGFAGMRFAVRAGTKDSFNAWVGEVKRSSSVLDSSEYNELLRPSENNPTKIYAQTNRNLFSDLLLKYNGSHGQHAHAEEGEE